MKKVICCIFAHEITKGMKSFGSIGLLKSNKKSTELLFCIIHNMKKHIKNICLVLGFDKDKIMDKIKEYNLADKLGLIDNTKYCDHNQAYAFKLSIESILKTYNNNIDGILFINNNNLIKNIPAFPKKKSWILIDKKSTKKRYPIGCFIKNNILQHMFYDLGDLSWAEIVYFSITDIQKIQTELNNLYYNNMFLFEIINTAVEHQNIVFETIHLDRASDLVRINGIKDKAKIK